MMNSIATYKESLSRISSEVFDAAEELDIPQSRREDSPASGRRISQRPSRFTSPVASSPVANGIRTDSGSPDEIEKYKADIQRLQASEAELKAFSLSYAAMLKEKEEQLSKLREENGSLRKNLDGKESPGNVLKDDRTRAVSNNFKVTVDRSPIRSNRNASQGNSRGGSPSLKSSPTKKDGFSNGGMQAVPCDATHQTITNSQGNEKELKKLLEEIRSLTTLQANYESEIKQLRAQLDSERENASTIKLKLHEECQLNESSQRELQDLKIEKERTFNERKELQKELREKILELKQLQADISRKGMDEPENLKNVVSVLENENAKLKVEKSELEASLRLHINSASQSTSKLNEKVVEEMEFSMRKMERTLEDTCKERDRALHELNRLKQHLLDKELEDSDKMDEDSKIIEDLRATTKYQQARILQLENAIKQEVARAEGIKNSKGDELQKANEAITELKRKLANCMSVADSKNIELQNLQTALGQYYAESEAKERLGRDLAATREQSAKLFDSLKAANQELEVSKREKEEMVVKLSHAERMLSEGKRAIQNLEEDNSKLRRALEQNMTRLNRMSMDSDNYVDRRIVIKLLVTFFQRNYSKEVLDLMVRMLGFSEEEKQRIGLAQSAAGKGVVRGVLGFPGRFVGGILGGSSHEASSRSPDNQSFADLWVDFLLKETEERERRESEEAAAARMSSSSQERNPTSSKSPSALNIPTSQFATNVPSRHFQQFEHSDSEFATVPLTSPFAKPTRNDPSSVPPRY